MTDDLVKVTFNLTPSAYAALEDAAALEGDTKVDTLNRALHMYCLMVAERKVGDRVWVGRHRLTAQEMTWS